MSGCFLALDWGGTDKIACQSGQVRQAKAIPVEQKSLRDVRRERFKLMENKTYAGEKWPSKNK
jgi:hypothetical protein